MLFRDRSDAAKQLAASLFQYKRQNNTLIIAIPRGGLQLGAILAQELDLPLDIILTKKIGYPNNPEFAIGVVGLEEEHVDESFIRRGEITEKYLQEEIKKLRKILSEREKAYRMGFAPLDLKEKTVIVTDDGVATGNTLLLTLELIRKKGAKKIIVAIPVGPPETIEKLKEKADEIICLFMPKDFFAVGQFYQNFDPVGDLEAIQLLRENHEITN